VEFDEDGVGENWDIEHLSALEKLTMTCSGEALKDNPSAVNSPSWVEKLNGEDQTTVPLKRSRAFKANVTGSKVMPSLRKKGSVKRMVFQHRKGPSSLCDLLGLDFSASHPANSAQDYAQHEYQLNYEEFLEEKRSRPSPRNWNMDGNDEEEQRKAFESAFLEDSQIEGWVTVTEVSSSESGD
jgi:hypothetical protein